MFREGKTRKERIYEAAINGDMSRCANPVSREEKALHAIAERACSGGGEYDKITLVFPEDSTFFGSFGTSNAFDGNKAIEDVVFPKQGEINFTPYMFQNCTSLSLTKLPDNTASVIDTYAFAGCTSLKINTLPTGVTSLNAYVFRGCTAITEFLFPEGFRRTNGNTFRLCTDLRKVDMPSTMESMNICEFLGCTALETLVIRSNTMVPIGSDAKTSTFQNTPIANGAGFVYVPASVIDAYKADTYWTTISDQFRAIEDYPDITIC